MSQRKRILAEHLILAALICQLGCMSANEPPRNSNASVATVSSDDSINNRVEERIRARGFSDVDVKTHEGHVFLTGYVDDEQQRAAAEGIANETPGVLGVQNEIVVCKKPPVNLNKPGGPRRC
jgi:osmotically-inducible protein OsmY